MRHDLPLCSEQNYAHIQINAQSNLLLHCNTARNSLTKLSGKNKLPAMRKKAFNLNQ